MTHWHILKVQGLISLVDCKKEDGGFHTVPKFSKYCFDEWARQNEGSEHHQKFKYPPSFHYSSLLCSSLFITFHYLSVLFFFSISFHHLFIVFSFSFRNLFIVFLLNWPVRKEASFVPVPKDDELFYGHLQAVPMRTGSMVVWNSKQPHGNYPNNSDHFRICQYLLFSFSLSFYLFFPFSIVFVPRFAFVYDFDFDLAFCFIYLFHPLGRWNVWFSLTSWRYIKMISLDHLKDEDLKRDLQGDPQYLVPPTFAVSELGAKLFSLQPWTSNRNYYTWSLCIGYVHSSLPSILFFHSLTTHFYQCCLCSCRIWVTKGVQWITILVLVTALFYWWQPLFVGGGYYFYWWH